jgi:hypothetical protein
MNPRATTGDFVALVAIVLFVATLLGWSAILGG